MYRVPAKSLSSVLILSASVLGHAQASSFVDVGLPAATPSIVAVGEPAEVPSQNAGGERFLLSASVVAIGADAIPPAREEVASVTQEDPAEPEAPSWTSDAVPTLMRGGIVAEAILPEDI